MVKVYVPHEENKDWRLLFPADLLVKAEKMIQNGCVYQFECNKDGASAVLRPRSGAQFEVKAVGPKSFTEEWDDSMLFCSCYSKRIVRYRRENVQYQAEVCHHQAALLMTWEKRHGPWHFPEPPALREERLRHEKEEREAAERERRRKAEAARLLKEKEQKKKPEALRVGLLPG